MNREQLFLAIQKKKSFLCIGLDTDIKKIPDCLLQSDDPVYEFNCRIIDATHDLMIACKPNLAFYESLGYRGWKSLEKTIAYIRSSYPDIFLIADAKRGDIGNTSSLYARAFFETMNFDAITVAPYMGEDSVSPFLSYKDKWIILLALTSNKGADDFQFFSNPDNEKLFERVLKQSRKWGDENNMMYVVGATKAEMLKKIRTIIPDHFILVPGVGAQGGSLNEVAEYGMNNTCGLIVNSSRDILYADSTVQFAEKAREKAEKLQHEIEAILRKQGLIK